jgi:hypothetical protein
MALDTFSGYETVQNNCLSYLDSNLFVSSKGLKQYHYLPNGNSWRDVDMIGTDGEIMSHEDCFCFCACTSSL